MPTKDRHNGYRLYSVLTDEGRVKMADPTITESERRVMQHLIEALGEEKPDVIVFSRDEAEVLVEWAKFMMAWKTLGRWGASLKQVILFFGGALALLAALRLGLLDWLGIGVAK